MDLISFTLNNKFFNELEKTFNLKGKNSHIAEKAVEIIKKFYESTYSDVRFETGSRNCGYDLKVIRRGKMEMFEIKGTEKDNLTWGDIRVSSKASYEAIRDGLTIIRVMNVGNRNIKIAYLKHGEHFALVEEPRWRISRIKK